MGELKSKVVKIIRRKSPAPQEGHIVPQLPQGWARPFDYIVSRSVDTPEVAPFPAMLLAALGGDNEALKRIYLAAEAAYLTAAHKDCPPKTRALCNAVTWLSNALAESLAAKLEPPQSEVAEPQHSEPTPEVTHV